MKYKVYHILFEQIAERSNVLFNRYIHDIGKLSDWNCDITPSSLARLLRVLNGKPAFISEVCVWTLHYDLEVYQTDCGEFDFMIHQQYTYCPYCGKKLKEVEREHSK